MKTLLNLYKPLGVTPLGALNLWREQHPLYTDATMTYCGRLDPMARGVLPVLAGERVHEKPEWIGLDKTYRCTALLGVQTDSYDLLGLPVVGEVCSDEEVIQDTLTSLIGAQTWSLPAFASYRVEGKPLHWWKREGRIDEITIPKRTMTFFDLEFGSVESASVDVLRTDILDRIGLVQGDFRQEEIGEAWKTVLDGDGSFTLVSFTVSCTSGSFIRSFVHELGERLACGACVYDLERTRVGELSVDDATLLLPARSSTMSPL